MKVISYTKAGTKQAEAVTLSKAVFGVDVTPKLLQQAYSAYLSNGRSAQANTLTRGLVRGGGKKPWRQKGTGRARVGSIRVPNWRGGGVVFGPTGLENHFVQMPLKMKRGAIRMALSAQAAAAKIVVIEDFAPEGKVKPALEILKKLEATGRVLIVVADKTDLIDRSTRNLVNVGLVQANYLNVYDVLNADLIVMTKPALEAIDQWLGEAKPVAKVEAVETKSKRSEPKRTATKAGAKS